MELEFDKEIDALMRKGLTGRGVMAGDTPKDHLDADELSAFAENTMPDRTRAVYMRHLADCDECRKILSNLIFLNAEAEPERSAAAVVSETDANIPWYRRLFIFPNLAYVMGGLVVVFGGLLAVSVFQSGNGRDSTAVSQITDDQYPSASKAAEDLGSSAPSSNSANAASNTFTFNQNSLAASNTATSSTPEISLGQGSALSSRIDENAIEEKKNEETGKGGEREADVQPSAAAPAPPPAKSLPINGRKVDDLRLQAPLSDKPASMAKDQVSPDGGSAGLIKTDENAQKMKQAASARDAELAKETNVARKMSRSESNLPDNTSRRVGGKDFRSRNGAWYDSAYRGQATTNVGRGTEDYRKLDRGLRNIAESLDGVVVVVWKEKAFRIQ